MRNKFSALIIFGLATAAAHSETKKPSRLEILTYTSMMGKGSLGDYAEKEFKKKCSDCEIKMSGTHENAGLLGRLRDYKRRGLSERYDVVMGMGESEFRQALVEGLVDNGRVFDKSTFAIIVDTKKLKADAWPKSWKDLPKVLKGSILIEDPRTSSVGVGWLTAIYGNKLIDATSAKATVRRTYPSWSSAYEAFTKGEAPAVWSFLSSESYHRCNEKTDEARTRYRALPLSEGYPVQLEYVARVKHFNAESLVPHADGTQGNVEAVARTQLGSQFVEFMLSSETQAAIPKKNWMYPGVDGTKLDACFVSPTAVKGLPRLDAFDLKSWMDKWSLQN